jgi:hypothetical protein
MKKKRSFMHSIAAAPHIFWAVLFIVLPLLSLLKVIHFPTCKFYTNIIALIKEINKSFCQLDENPASVNGVLVNECRIIENHLLM